MEKRVVITQPAGLIPRIYDIGLLIKFKLLLFVVFSASIAYLLGIEGAINWSGFFWLTLGGVLVTGAANGLNQILEKDADALMTRTRSRPLPSGRMDNKEATLLSIVMGLAGLYVLAEKVNLLCGILGMLALFLYAFAYTPLKRVGPFSVFIGAIPGAMPPLIGWVAATDELNIYAFTLFSIQFLWQFPHFWAIAWKLDEDYAKAGFKLLPSKNGKSKAVAFQTVVYTASLIPAGLIPFWLQLTGMVSASIVTAAALIFTWYALRLYQTCSERDARKLMFASIVYLPVVMIAFVLDKM